MIGREQHVSNVSMVSPDGKGMQIMSSKDPEEQVQELLGIVQAQERTIQALERIARAGLLLEQTLMFKKNALPIALTLATMVSQFQLCGNSGIGVRNESEQVCGNLRNRCAE